MGWVRIDDGIFFNRKVTEAGKDATLLYLSCLTVTAKQLTDGKLSAAQLRLAASAVGVAPKVAGRLLTVGLLEKCEDGYVVPDYLEYNPSATVELDRRAKDRDRKRAARAKGAQSVTNGPDGKFTSGRVRTDVPPDGRADDQADGDEDSTVKSAATPSSLVTSQSSTNDGCDPGKTDDDEAVAAVLALADLERRRNDKPDQPVGDEERWLAAATRRRLNLDKAAIRATLEANPTWTAEQCARSMLEGGTKPSALDATAAAQAALMDRNQRAEPACKACDDRGVVELKDGTFDDCECKFRTSA